MLSALATFGEAHFLVYQSLNSLVSRDFLLDVLNFLLAVVSVSLVLKNSNKPINNFFDQASWYGSSARAEIIFSIHF